MYLISWLLTVWVIARYAGFNIAPIYVLDLMALLLPTTIMGLEEAIIIFGTSKLRSKGITVTDNIVLDNVVDVNIVLLDKTGTITMGTRIMTDFVNVSDIGEESFLNFLYLSSFQDATDEGQSIKDYIINRGYEEITVDRANYEYFPFSSADPISGCNYNGIEIRKGSVNAIMQYLGIDSSDEPQSISLLANQIAITHGTPLLFTFDKKIIGIIHLRDCFRPGIMKQLQKFQDQNLRIILLTGDNEMTAKYVAQGVGLKEWYGDSTPGGKLKIVRDLQRQGYVVAMCGDGLNDSLALAQADVGFTFENNIYENTIMKGNVISEKHDISNLLQLKNICKKITVKRGILTVFSLTSNIVTYFILVPALFTTAFPALGALNFMNFQSPDSVILASIMFNALIIPALIPFILADFSTPQSKYALWQGIIFYGIGGIVSPFIFIKLIEIALYYLGLV